jgi:metal-responsive CopG/Arc/MetJ family transcriptional regulator
MLPENLLNQMDQVAAAEDMNRSQLVRTAVLAYFDRLAETNQRQQRQNDILRAMDIQDHLRQTHAPWDALKILRDQREEA